MRTKCDSDDVSQDYMACLINGSSTKILPLSMLNVGLICLGFLKFTFVYKECVKWGGRKEVCVELNVCGIMNCVENKVTNE